MTTIPQELGFYNTEGFSVIPLKPRDKLPNLPSWKPYQSGRAPLELQQVWWPKPLPPEPNNIGIITGAVSGNLIVLDLDNEDAYRMVWEACPELAETATVATGRGYHLYLRAPVDPGPTFILEHDEVEGVHHVKANGGYVVAPPSIHPSGSVYQWLNTREILEIELPELVRQLKEAGFHERTKPEAAEVGGGGHWGDFVAATYATGSRADALSRLAGFLRGAIDSESVTRELLRAWNKEHCQPPLPDGEVVATVRSMYRRYRPWDDEPLFREDL